MRHTRLRGALQRAVSCGLLALSLATGCFASDGPTEALSIEQLEVELATVFCENVLVCGWPTRVSATDPASCAAELVRRDALPRPFQLPNPAALARMTYDPEAARALVEAYSRTCDPYSAIAVAARAEVFTGLQREGEPCTTSYECTPGLRCVDGADDSPCGVCVAPTLALGAPCERAEQCAESIPDSVYCRDAGLTGTYVCTLFETIIRRDGESCGMIHTPALQTQQVCEAGLACVRGSDEALGVCTARAELGEPCDEATPCARDLVCAATETGFECKARELATTVGASCTNSATDPGPWCDWAARLACVDGQCAAVAVGTEGQPCNEGDLGSCAAGLHCTLGTCTRTRALGESCTPDAFFPTTSDCAEGRCLDDGTGQLVCALGDACE